MALDRPPPLWWNECNMKLTEYLVERSETIGSFAGRIDVSHETVRRYVREERRPDWKVLEKIAAATDGKVTANDFIATA